MKQIVQDKRVAQEQEKQVNAEAEKIGKEAAEADEIARVVQGELDKALPALQSAEDALNVLTKKDISELKAYAKPPGLVELTLQGSLYPPSRYMCLPASSCCSQRVLPIHIQPYLVSSSTLSSYFTTRCLCSFDTNTLRLLSPPCRDYSIENFSALHM